MRFAHPEILLAMFALPLLALFFWWAQQRKWRLLGRFGRRPLLSRLSDNVSTGRQVVKMGLLTAAVGLLIVALARPQIGSIEKEIERRGIDLMVALDVSNSMLARDIDADGGKISRLEYAKRRLRQLILISRGHRIGVIAFAGTAFVQCPLTLDYGLARQILESLDTRIIATQGTSLGTAIDTAIDAFERGDPGNRAPAGRDMGDRVLLLLTDGEDHDQKALQGAVDRAVKAGIRIFAIGVGSTHGSLIEMPDGRFKKDDQERNVQTRLDFDALQRIARQTGGVAIHGGQAADRNLVIIRNELASLEQSIHQSSIRTVHKERFVPVLLLVVILLIWEALFGDRKRPQPVAVGQEQPKPAPSLEEKS
jgi:Ca-activated chloride channel family protein